jgi:hypothetical protein
MFRYGLSREAKDGSFPGSAWPFHGTALFLSEAAPSLIVLARSQYAPQFRPELQWMADRMRRAAYFMVRSVHGPPHIDDRTKNHRFFEAAIGLGATGALFHDGTLIRWSQQYAWRGIRMQWPNGVMPENGGHDSGYQALGMTSAERYLALSAGGSLRHALEASLKRGEAWELFRIRADGSIDQGGDTRTAGCRERGPSGACKTAFYAPVVATLSRWAVLTGDERFARAAGRVHTYATKG